MKEVEALRKEVNELRERIARLEARGKVEPGPMWNVPAHMFTHMQPVQPAGLPDMAKVFPPGTIIG